jgi:hypothetical protein
MKNSSLVKQSQISSIKDQQKISASRPFHQHFFKSQPLRPSEVYGTNNLSQDLMTSGIQSHQSIFPLLRLCRLSHCKESCHSGSSKITMTEATAITSAPIYDLLGKLPVELRLEVYKHSFEGCQVEAIFAEDLESLSTDETSSSS